MSLRMFSLWIVGALLVAATLKADPPQKQVAPELPRKPGVKISAENNQVVVEGAGSALKATSVEFRESPQQQVRFDVKVWDVDHAKLRVITKSDSGVFSFYRVNGLAKLPEGLNLEPPHFELSVSPLTVPVRAFAVRDRAVSKTLHGHDISSAFTTISEPTLVALNGREATLLSGGQVPIFVARTGDPEVISFHEFGLKLKLLPRLMDKDRITLGLDFENSELEPKAEVGDSDIGLISSQGFRLSAQMKLDEQLLVAQQTGKHDVTRLVQIQPTLNTDQPVAQKPNGNPELLPNPPSKIASPATPAVSNARRSPPSPASHNTPPANDDGTLTVEDRWPLGDIKVGQPVIAIPVMIDKTSLVAHLFSLDYLNRNSDASRVIRIEPLPDQKGRRVTMSLPFSDSGIAPGNDKWKALRSEILDHCGSATATFVVPTASISMAEVFEQRLVRNIYDQIPMEMRPRPVEVMVGDILSLTGIAPLGEPAQGHRAEVGPFSLEHIDDGFWRTTATKPGMTRLIQLSIGGNEVSPARVTEYLVKTDTRELELHIRQQFPSAKVAITSVGTSSLLLTGTVASDEDSHGIVGLAQEFAPKVLNRLKIPGPGAEPRAMRLENGIEVTQVPIENREPTELNPKRDRIAKTLQPSPVKPVSATSSKANDELRELLHEIRELRQEVRTLNERLERERPATDETSRTEPLKPTENAPLIAKPSHGPAPLTPTPSAWAGPSDVAVLSSPNVGRSSRSISLADLPGRLNTEFDKLKLHMEVTKALIETAIDARGITISEDELQRHFGVLAEKDGLPAQFYQQFLKQMPNFQLFLEGTRQQLALVKLSGKSTEPTPEELDEAFAVAQRGTVEVGRMEFASKALAQHALGELRLNPDRREEILKKYFVTGVFPSVPIIPTYPPMPAETAVSHLKDGEFSDVVSEAQLEREVFVIYRRKGLAATHGKIDSLRPRLRAQLIVNKVNQIVEAQTEQIRRAYRLHVVPIYEPIKRAEPGSVSWDVLPSHSPMPSTEQPTKGRVYEFQNSPPTTVTGPTKLTPAQIPLHNADWASPAQPGNGPAKLDPLAVQAGQASSFSTSKVKLVGPSWEDIANRQRKYKPAEDDAKLIIKTYSVAQLVVPAQPMHMQFRVDDNKAKLVGNDKPVPPANSLAQLLEMIKSTIAPDSWEEAGGNGQITANDSKLSLVVRQTQAVHEELRSLLDALRKLSDQQVSLELRVIKTDENFRGFGFDLPVAWTQLKPNESQLLNSKDADAIIAAAQQEQRTSLFNLPKLTLMAGQPMTLEVNGGSLPAPLHLSGFAMPLAADGHGFARLHLSARGTDEKAVVQNLTTVRDGHSLLINLTNVIRYVPPEGVPILETLPHQPGLLKNFSGATPLKRGEQLFLLATPRLIAPEAEEELLLGVPK